MDIATLKQVLDYLNSYSATSWISLASGAFGFVCLHALYKPRPELPAPRWPLWGSIVALSLLVIVQGLTLWHPAAGRTTTPKDAFDALQANKRVYWAVRLIPYSRRTEPYLSIQEIKTLGQPSAKYIFVADYDELKGLTVASAVYRLGLSLKDKDSVSAIVFPLSRRDLYPANARGVLQVIQAIDAELAQQPAYIGFDVASKIDKSALEQLADRRRNSWSWDAYSIHYGQFEIAVSEARSRKVSALDYIGRIGVDWHPVGYSQIISESASLSSIGQIDFVLKAPAGRDIKVNNFGARAFLIANLKLEDIDHLVLMHFSDLDKDRLPDLNRSVGAEK